MNFFLEKLTFECLLRRLPVSWFTVLVAVVGWWQWKWRWLWMDVDMGLCFIVFFNLICYCLNLF
ncbi:hypothetical protein HanRHA438_Chr17g0820231 [Helianthus annuus]|nr:hypothetical protein HanRHA438_Chr17g0820231 [Helianthus annuus]